MNAALDLEAEYFRASREILTRGSGMSIEIPDLKIEHDGNAPDAIVLLEQDGGSGNIERVALHPCQVRLLAERVGILALSSNIEADRTIARLCRQMRLLLQRIDQLDDWLNQAAQPGLYDLAMETTYSFATWELATEFCADLPDRASALGQPLSTNTSSPSSRATKI